MNLRRIILLVSLISGVSFGMTLAPDLWASLSWTYPWLTNPYVNGGLFGFIFVMIGLLFIPRLENWIHQLQEAVNRQTPATIVLGTGGTLAGLLIGYLASLPFTNLGIPIVSTLLPFVLSIVLAIVGFQTAISRREEWEDLFKRGKEGATPEQEDALTGQMLERREGLPFYKYKILDTSVIIDGRINDILETNFLEGILVIPNFVLKELQNIADSADSLRRTKGRRGLDMLNDLQKNESVQIEYYDGDFEDVPEVDSKLMKLAKLIDGAIVTNDYNLNKVSEFQNIKVFNINELANALKPVLVPGESLNVLILKDGTERKQGVAYLEDGTMVVVEDGQYYKNEWINVTVTSALQTNAGRMIFAKLTHSRGQIENTDKNK